MKKRLSFLVIGVVILALFLLMACFPQIFTQYDRKTSFGMWLPMSSEHLLGTNALGYDIFTELVYGSANTLLVGIAASVLTLLIGVIVGVLSSFKGAVGVIFNGIINIFMMLPRLIVLIVLSAFLGSSTINLIILIACFNWVGTARAVRAKIQHIQSQTYIEVCQMYGYSKKHTIIKHVLPNLSDVLLSRFLLGVNSCILMEATLSFLGFGDLYYPTWGVMINFAWKKGALLVGAYQYALVPCICIMLVSLAFYFIALFVEGKQNTING